MINPKIARTIPATIIQMELFVGEPVKVRERLELNEFEA